MRYESQLPIENNLKTLGIELLCDWDVLVFLYRHRASLVSGEHIARLLGYGTGGVLTAIETLESLGLVGHSRVSQGVRLYEFTALPDGGPSKAFNRLINLAESRTGRLRLVNTLRSGPGSVEKKEHSNATGDAGGELWQKAS